MPLLRIIDDKIVNHFLLEYVGRIRGLRVRVRVGVGVRVRVRVRVRVSSEVIGRARGLRMPKVGVTVKDERLKI